MLLIHCCKLVILFSNNLISASLAVSGVSYTGIRPELLPVSFVFFNAFVSFVARLQSTGKTGKHMGTQARRMDEVAPPTESEAEMAKSSSRLLAACIGEGATARIKIIEGNKEIEVPIAALKMFVNILAQMAQGNGVTLMPIHAELTTQEAADFLNVSRPFVVGLIDKGELNSRRVGTHRRVKFQELMAYREKSLIHSRKILDQMAADDKESGVHY
jgi:excisionase family DNA binding protein